MHLKGHGRCTQRFNLKSMRKYTTWTDCVVRKYDLCKKAPSWNIFIMWKQTGGEDVVRNMEQTNASSVNTRGLSSGKFTIDLHGKEMGWVMGPQSWPLQWRKRAQPLDYFQTDRSEHRGKVYSWKEKTLIKNRLEALGNRIPFSGKNIEALLVPDPDIHQDGGDTNITLVWGQFFLWAALDCVPGRLLCGPPPLVVCVSGGRH